MEDAARHFRQRSLPLLTTVSYLLFVKHCRYRVLHLRNRDVGDGVTL